MGKLLTIMCFVVSCCSEDATRSEEKEAVQITTTDVAQYYLNASSLWSEIHEEVIKKEDEITSEVLIGVNLIKLNREDEDEDFYVRYAVGAVFGGKEGVIDGYLDVYRYGDMYEARLIVGTRLLSQMDVVMKLGSHQLKSN